MSFPLSTLLEAVEGLHWSARYISIPYIDQGRSRAGVDCWGLVCLAVAGETGVELPGYAGEYMSADEQREVAAIVAREAASPIWRRLEPAEVRPFDVAIFRQPGHRRHAGVVTEPGEMLHMVEEESAKVERYDSGRWFNLLVGVYRFHRLENRP